MYGVNKMVAFVLLIPSVKENIKNKYNFLAKYYIFEGKKRSAKISYIFKIKGKNVGFQIYSQNSLEYIFNTTHVQERGTRPALSPLKE